MDRPFLECKAAANNVCGQQKQTQCRWRQREPSRCWTARGLRHRRSIDGGTRARRDAL